MATTLISAPSSTANMLSIELREDASDGMEASYLLYVSSFLVDFNRLYELTRIGVEPNYFGTYELKDFAGRYIKEGRLTSLRPSDVLTVRQLSKRSPLALIAVVAATPATIGAVWGIMQIAEKGLNWPINRRILELQRG